MATTHTVVRGDTLSEIAVRYGTTVAELVRLNNISDPDYIVVGQVIKLSGTPDKEQENKLSMATLKMWGLQSNTDRTLYATWYWSKDHTDHYQVMWYYDTGDGVWFVGEDSTVEYKQCTYNAPANAKRVKFKVKPVSTKHKVNGKETSYWTAAWSTEKTGDFWDEVPDKPSTPTVKLDKYKLTAEVNNLDATDNKAVTRVQFQIVKNNKSVFSSGTANVSTRHASYSCTVDAGAEYKVRCRAFRGSAASEWSDYSENVKAIPSAVTSIKTCRASSETSVYLEWNAVTSADKYDVEYTNKREYFDGSNATTVESDIEFTHYELTGLETGEEYFFRVRAVNDQGYSAWSEIATVTIGKKPAAPTTWSSTTTVTVGEPLNLYWVHNTEDNSSQTYAELEIMIDGETVVRTIKNTEDEEEKDKTSFYAIDTSVYTEGIVIQWRVRTAGVTKQYGDWSIQRKIDIYAPPTLELRMTNSNAEDIDVLTSFPFYIYGLAGPNTQTPIGYHLVVKANDAYETVDQVGNVKMVKQGEQIYSRYFDIDTSLTLQMSANHIDLENNVSYTITCVASMNSGLTAESSVDFTVAWSGIEYEPNAEITVDEDTLAASIMPYCEDESDGITLSVYRREFDGTFTEIATGIPNGSNTFVTDPHPALDYARYRIVAISSSTGAVSYYDAPGYPIGEKAAIIQWNEEWRNFDTTSENVLAEPTWSGSMLKLPYNIDVSDNRNIDVALVEYIGRSHPISYYGTQLGETSSWTMQIPKDDKETLYALRRLSIWKGDVYVREPSGSGYWANVSVSFSQKHREVTIPVSLDIRRVEGGI